MNTRFLAPCAALLTVCGLMPSPAWAQAPGEDPVILTKKLSLNTHLTLPTTPYV